MSDFIFGLFAGVGLSALIAAAVIEVGKWR